MSVRLVQGLTWIAVAALPARGDPLPGAAGKGALLRTTRPADRADPVALGEGAAASAPDDAIPALVARLASGNFAEREQAAHRLLDLSTSATDTLARVYQQTDDYEVRLRIQEIVEDRFFQERLFNHMGFLGVGPQVVGPAEDPRVAADHTGVLLSRVVEDSAAERAGLRENDLITEVEGQPLPGDLSSGGFSRMIRDTGAGQPLRLTVFRDDAAFTVEVVLGTRPLEYYFQQDDSTNLERLEQTIREFPVWFREHFASAGRDRPAPPSPVDQPGGAGAE